MATGKWRAQEEEDKLKLLLTDSSAGDDYVHHYHGKRYGTASSAGETEELESLAGSTYLPLRYKEEHPTIRNQMLQMTINALNPGSCDCGGWSYVLLAIAAVVMFPPLGTAALVLAILARQNAVRDRKSSERYSRTSLIISSVSIISGLIVLALVLGFTQSSRNDTSKLAKGANRHVPRASTSSLCPQKAPYLHDEFCYKYMVPVNSRSDCIHGHYGNHHCYYESRDKHDNAGRCDMATDGYCYTSSCEVCSSTNEQDCFWYAFPTESTRCINGHRCGSFCGYSFRYVNNLWHLLFVWADCDCLNDMYCYCY